MRFSTSLITTLSVLGLVTALPEPQAPGSEKYECHAKCGSIISASRKADFTTTCASHRAAYSYCLECAGPEAQNIWSMYGTSVAAAGEKCGWPTTPGADFPAEEEKEEEQGEKLAESTTTTEAVVTPTTTTAEVEVTATASVAVEPTATTVPVGNNDTVGGNSTNGGAIPTPESDGAAASGRFVSAGVVAIGFAAVAFLL